MFPAKCFQTGERESAVLVLPNVLPNEALSMFPSKPPARKFLLKADAGQRPRGGRLFVTREDILRAPARGPERVPKRHAWPRRQRWHPQTEAVARLRKHREWKHRFSGLPGDQHEDRSHKRRDLLDERAKCSSHCRNP